jgi:pantetheine-phosphate adenylyltransferase
MKRVAIFPGTFDPVTLGHLDVLERAAHLFDRVVVGVAAGHHKSTLFSLEDRIEMFRENLSEFSISRVRFAAFDGLLVDFAKEKGANAIVRGIRSVRDYEYELQMAQLNRTMSPELETVFLVPAEKFSSVQSSRVREIARYGGKVRAFVPRTVERRLRKAMQVEKSRAGREENQA